MLIVSTGVGACGAHKQKPAAPAIAGVVEIPTATPDQLKSFDSDKNALPASARHATTAAEPPPRRRYVEVHDPWRSSQAAHTPRGGPDCVAAARCCRLLQAKHGLPSSTCDKLRRYPTPMCHQLVVLLRRASVQYGVSCP